FKIQSLLCVGAGLLCAWAVVKADAGNSAVRAVAAGLLAPRENLRFAIDDLRTGREGWRVGKRRRSGGISGWERKDGDEALDLGEGAIFHPGGGVKRHHLRSAAEGWFVVRPWDCAIWLSYWQYAGGLCGLRGETDMAS